MKSPINYLTNAERAKKHTEEMNEKYSDEIMDTVKNTKLYDIDFHSEVSTNDKNATITVEDSDTVSAVKKYHNNGKTALLNFSSYKNPGGGFINGCIAQEECLCHESYLYNVLSKLKDFYDWNNEHKNKAMYLNRGLYSPNVLFQRENESFYCDVITCAAPNRSASQRHKVSNEENTEALRSRIKFLLDIAKENQVDTLILGAYGCGVFRQDPVEVASIFKEYLETTHKCFEKVIFAIPNGKNGNLKAFEQIF